jgi:hypothetical protein
MEESEHCVEQAARSGTPTQALVASRILEHPAAYLRWEGEHSFLMRQVSEQRRLAAQVVALRSTALALMHRKALFEYMRDRELTGARRHRLIALFHGCHDYAAAVIAEHGNYLRCASSYLCSHHLAERLLVDPAFAEPLLLYEERYTEYFRVFCDVALAHSDEEKRAVDPLRALQPLLKLQLGQARREILTMRDTPPRQWREVEIRKSTGGTQRLRALAPGAHAGHSWKCQNT